jgi:hypothetical protein
MLKAEQVFAVFPLLIWGNSCQEDMGFGDGADPGRVGEDCRSVELYNRNTVSRALYCTMYQVSICVGRSSDLCDDES